MDFQNLKNKLDHLYDTFDFSDRLKNDPVSFPHRYESREDIEVAGFIASAFAFGRVEMFMPVIDRLLSVLGKSPFLAVADRWGQDMTEALGNLHYRFYTGKDVVLFIGVLSILIRKYGDLKGAFKRHLKGEDLKGMLEGFSGECLDIGAQLKRDLQYKKGERSGFHFFFPSPRNGSPCKRLNLFLRWMVRKGDIDLGIWDFISPSKLVIPLDAHISRIGRCLGLTTRKTPDWKMALEITESLKRFDINDPLRYDFALCHQGIQGVCNSRCKDNNTGRCPVF